MMKNFEWLTSLRCRIISQTRSRSSRQFRRQSSNLPERLEPRIVLTNPPVLQTISNVTLISGSPLHLALNASDDNQLLTFSATSSDSSVTTFVPEGNRSIEVDVQSFGTMTFQLFEQRVPGPAKHLATLAETGFYNGSSFFQVTSNGHIAGGDQGVGSGIGPIDDQFHVDLQHNAAGYLSLQKQDNLPDFPNPGDPPSETGLLDDTSDSAFLITGQADRRRDANHALIGFQTTGDAVRDAISQVAVDGDGVPDTTVTINSVSLLDHPTFGALDHENGVLMLQAPEGFTGSTTITVTVEDPDGNMDQTMFDVTVVADQNAVLDGTDTQAWLQEPPTIVRTLEGIPTALELTAVDVEGQGSVFFDQDDMSSNAITVPDPAPEGFYTIEAGTNIVTVTPPLMQTGIENISVATGLFVELLDFQVIPIEMVATASSLTVSTADHPRFSQADDGNADTIRLIRNGTRFELFVNDTLTAQAEDISVSEFIINGSGDDDHLIIDWAGGNPLPNGSITFNAGSQVTATGDTLELLGGSATTVTHTFTSQTDGSIELADVITETISFTGVEPIIEEVTATYRVFSFSDIDDDITVGDDDVPADGVSRITATGTGRTIDFQLFSGTLVINTGGGNDSVTVNDLDDGAKAVTVNGGAGNDTIIGSTLADLLNGGADNDELTGAAGADTLFGADGDDRLFGGSQGDRLDGGTGADTLSGSGSSDTLTGGAGDDRIDAGPANDRLIEFAVGNSTLTPDSWDGNGTDTLVDLESAVIDGDASPNSIDAGTFGGPVTLRGNGGDDSLFGGSEADLIEGGDGNDSIVAAGADDTVTGGDGNDTLKGASGKDSLDGGAGDDSLLGQGTTGDTLTGGVGDDVLDGGSGNDIIIESTDVNLFLSTTALAGLGVDTLISVERALLSGGAGNNRIEATGFAPSLVSVTLLGGGGNDTLLGTIGNDVLGGEGGNDSLLGNNGGDRLFGGAGRDRLIGEDGDDWLRGQGGSGDTLSGGHGDDTLNGGGGNDRLVESGDFDFTLTGPTLTGRGTDLLIALENARIDGGNAANTIDVSGSTLVGTITVAGADGDDSIIGSDNGDLLIGGGGNDTLNGNGGDDILQGGADNDLLTGGDGNDGLSGATGTDNLNGGTGSDTAYGGSDDDTLRGGDDADILIGGDGADDVDGEAATDDTVAGGSGDGAADMGDVVADSISEVDEAFMLDPLPSWVEEV